MIIIANKNVDILSGNYNTLLFGLMVKFGLLLQPYGILNSAFRFSIIQPSGFGLMDPPLKKVLLLFRLIAPNEGVGKQYLYCFQGNGSDCMSIIENIPKNSRSWVN